MKLPPRKIWPFLGAIALAIVIAYPPIGGQGESATAAKHSPQSTQPVSSQPTALQPKSQLDHVDLDKLNQQRTKSESGKAITNAFKSTSWYIAPPPPPPPPLPPAPIPTAPPLPFTYMGRYEDPPKRLVILASGSKLYTVSEGETIDGNYRVDRITDRAVELVYLPLNINQSISTTGAPENTQQRFGAEQSRRP
jgi:hypothetical protein